MSGPERGRLRLIYGDHRFQEVHRPPTTASLNAAIVRAALEWAALAMESSEAIDVATQEGQLRMNLIDRIHDAEYHAWRADQQASAQADIFEGPPGA